MRLLAWPSAQPKAEAGRAAPKTAHVVSQSSRQPISAWLRSSDLPQTLKGRDILG